MNRELTVRNPRTGENDYTIQPPSDTDLESIAAELRSNQATWASAGIEGRCSIVTAWVEDLLDPAAGLGAPAAGRAAIERVEHQGDGGVVHTHCGGRRPCGGRAGGTLRRRRRICGELRLRLPNRISDQFIGDGARALQIRRFCARWDALDHFIMDRIQPVCTLVVWTLKLYSPLRRRAAFKFILRCSIYSVDDRNG